MKPLLAAMAGFVVALGLFAGGIAVATGVIMVDEAPRARVAGDVAEVWTAKPRPVDVAAQDFERIGPAVIADAGVDSVTTAALPTPAIADGAIDEGLAELRAAHEEWCSRRYRSYDPATDSYRPYRGGTSPCLSPYSQELTAEQAAIRDEPVFAQDVAAYPASHDGESMPPQRHVRDCLSRYRSYRVEDNSYQPYGGGPRRQCE